MEAQSNEIEISHKFQPFFELLNEEMHAEVDTVILTGGRASSKSYNVSLLSLIGVNENEWRVLYSRFTNSSIGDSIKSEVSEKIEVLGYEGLMVDTQFRIESTQNKGFISFKGIKTGSKGQTANLKSLNGFNVFVVDEAEEIPSEDIFKKVFYSIRSVEKRNISILVLNPTTKEHWIWNTFFEKRAVESGFTGIKDNVMYIHSSYLDVNPDYVPENIRKDYERLKIEDPEEYDNVVMGGWISEPKGVLFKRSDLKWFTELPKEGLIVKLAFIDPADTGKDCHSVPVGYLYDNGKCYIEDVLYTDVSVSENVEMTADILNVHKPDYVRVEVNMGGSMYPELLEPRLDKSIMLLPIRETTNKHARIFTMNGFIKRFFVFREDYTHGSDYHRFVNNITQYMADGTSKHDDAPDSCTGLANMVKSFYAELYY